MMKVSFSRLKASFERSSPNRFQSFSGGTEMQRQRAHSVNNVNACNHSTYRDAELLSSLGCGSCAVPKVRSKSTSSRSINTIFGTKGRDAGCKAVDRGQVLHNQRSFLNAVRCKISKRFKQPAMSGMSTTYAEETAEPSWLSSHCGLSSRSPVDVGSNQARTHKAKSPALNSVHPVDHSTPIISSRSSTSRSSHQLPLQRGSLYRGRTTEHDESTALPSLPPRSPPDTTTTTTPALPSPPVERSLAQELRTLLVFGWYWGPISKLEAEARLSGLPDGAFLVRDSSDDRYVLSLSFRSCGSTRHTRIQHANGAYSFYVGGTEAGDSCASIPELIETAMERSRQAVYCYIRDGGGGERDARVLPVRLTRPVSRRTQVPSLQALCRFVIRQHVRLDLVKRLPLPDPVKAFVELNVL